MRMRSYGVFSLAALFCVTLLFAFVASAFAEETLEARRARLEAQLASIEQDIVEKRGVLSEKQQQRASLERDIGILDNQITIAQQQIKHRDITISKIRDDIGDKKTAIGEVDKKVLRSEQSLAQLIRRTREIDDVSLAELVVSGSITSFFEDIAVFESL